MSYLKSSFNVCVFNLGELSLSPSEVHEKLHANRFMELSPSQEQGVGWVAADDIFRTDFGLEDCVAGTGIVGGFRIDVKAVPKPLLKKLFKEKLRERQRDLGEKLTKADKQILKEECKEQLLLKTLPNPKMVTWIWDREKNRIYLDSKSPKVVDAFSAFFSKTFDTPLEIMTFGIESDEITHFLDWLWKNVNSLETSWVDQDVTLGSEEDTFKFKGPDIGKHVEEIDSFKKDKTVKTIGIGTVINKHDFYLTFSAKNMIIGAANKNKIKHESIETAVLDNSDNINSILETVGGWVDMYMKG